MFLSLTVIEFTTLLLFVSLLFIAFKLAETNWSYKISKPHAWEEAVKKNEVSRKLRKIERFYRDKVRFYTFWFVIQRLKKENIKGAFAEVGVYQGETARMIHEMDSSRKLHLFDTFEGFDQKDIATEKMNDDNRGIDFSDTSIDAVAKYINGNDNVVIHKGYFPDTAEHLSESQYAFVHLDADLYKPTLAGLQYFYPRLAEGGVIIIHDYNHTWTGATEAVRAFVQTIPENIGDVVDWQGSAVIVKNKTVGKI